jgi:hypothetical protein
VKNGYAIWKPRRRLIKTPQRIALVHSDIIRLVALDLILRVIVSRVMYVTFVVHILGVHSHDPAANTTSLRIPTHVITNFECRRHRIPAGTTTWSAIQAMLRPRKVLLMAHHVDFKMSTQLSLTE